jgi:hypothetical protein
MAQKKQATRTLKLRRTCGPFFEASDQAETHQAQRKGTAALICTSKENLFTNETLDPLKIKFLDSQGGANQICSACMQNKAQDFAAAPSKGRGRCAKLIRQASGQAGAW